MNLVKSLRSMTENPDYWNTIATVIPVVALTYATAQKRSDWHRMNEWTRRWTALYGAAMFLLLVFVEILSLQHLQERSTSSQDETFSLLVVIWAAAHVLALPISPLIILAVHDLHPKVLRAKRALKSDERQLAQIQREYDEASLWIDRTAREYQIQGSEQVLRDLSLAFAPSGLVRDDYLDRVSGWRAKREILVRSREARVTIEEKFRAARKQHKRSQKRLEKALRTRTKNAAKLTELHR
jgi:hypothetical protein